MPRHRAPALPRKEGKGTLEIFRRVVEAAPTALVMVDGAGRIALLNTQAEKLFGYAREELLGRPIEVLLPLRSRKAHRAHRAGFSKAPQTRAMGAGRDLFGLRKDGAEVPVEIGLNPFATASGAYVVASIIDITQRRALEKKLAHSETLATIGGMVTVVAHEIRNPLSSIVLAAKALSRGGLAPEESAEALSVLIKESRRLNENLEDFLQFARPREPRKLPGDLNQAAREVLSAIKADGAVVGKAEILEKLDSSLPPIPFDAHQIRQVLWNIIRNGFQALHGKGRLEVRTESRDGEAVVHVTDSGPGIPPDRLDKVFVPFFTTKAKGTGLGLPISRNIVRAHGGDIRLESRPGRGSRFSIILPRSA